MCADIAELVVLEGADISPPELLEAPGTRKSCTCLLARRGRLSLRGE